MRVDTIRCADLTRSQMEKRTLLAVILSVVVISGSYLIQNWLFPPAPSKALPQTTEQTVNPVSPSATSPGESIPAQKIAETSASQIVGEAETIFEETVVVQTDLVRVQLTNRGGDVLSYRLLKHFDGAEPVEMIFGGGAENRAFSIAFGNAAAKPVDDLFHVKPRISENVVEFYRDYSVPQKDGTEPSRFRLTKRYEFRPGEYLFELAVTIDGGYSVPALNFGGIAYTVASGPQIGPKFQKLTQNYEYRKYYTYTNGKRKSEKVNNKALTTISSRISWAAIAGKYFTLIAVPDATQYELAFSAIPGTGIAEPSRMFLSRPTITGSKVTDTYRFYFGPKTQKALAVYNAADSNSFKLGGASLGAVVDTSGILGPLEVAMKWFLMIFYKIVPNYGIAIILLTILVKVLMFPLTKKGSESTLRMQALSPKIKEIQVKFKDNPNKMNVEMAEFYKREGYNPMSGCLPMLLQIPIFFAMYNLFNNHFDLRGAMFIPGWIPDLSMPETIWNFAPFSIPFLNWSNLRLLPFVYLGSQLLYGKVTQTPDQQGNSQMKMMLYMMPVMFFFILYDVPAGLLLYWIMSNLLTLVQQVAINKYLAKKKAHMAVATGPVIAPKRKKG